MSTQAITTSVEGGLGATPIVIGVALVLSVGIHLGAGWSVWVLGDSMPSRAASEIEDLAVTRMEPSEEDLALGIDESNSATINWLGVVENEQVGEATDSVVDQAALVNNPGASPSPQQSQPSAQSDTQPTAQTQQPDPETQTDAEPEPEQPTPPVQTTPIDVPELVESPEAEIVVPKPFEADQPEPEPSRPDEIKSPESPTTKPTTKPTPEPTPVEREPAAPKEPVAKPAPEPPAKPTVDSPAGKPGELSEREAIAMATDVVYDQMHRPLVSNGIELITKQPKYPWSVRNAAMPKNAIVIIRFGRDGRVKSADFLVSKDGKRRYDTGMLEVDSPLLAAIYQWRAKGERLLDIDPDDPNAIIEIPMRILFSKPRAKKTDEQ